MASVRSPHHLFMELLRAGLIVIGAGLVLGSSCQDLLNPDDGNGPDGTREAVARVEVAPSSAILQPGQTQQFTAEAVDGSGGQVATTFTWSATGGSISEAGMYTAGNAPGSFAVIVTEVSGIADTGSVTIADPNVSLATECQNAKPAWIWCDDFEQNRLDEYFEYLNPGGDGFIRLDGVGIEGSLGMRARFDADQVQAGYLSLALGKTPDAYFRPVDDGAAKYRELYWRIFLRHQPGWSGGGGDKLSRATVFAGSNWSQAMIAHVWSGASSRNGTNQSRYYLQLDPASGTDEQGNLRTTIYNDFDNLRWLGLVQGATPLFDSGHVGEWYCVEIHVKLNGAGQSNGVFEFWLNDELEARKTGLNWLGAYSEYGLNAIMFENYWNSGSPRIQERYFDNIVVSTQRVGCGA